MAAAMVWMMALDQSTMRCDHVGFCARPLEFKAVERGVEVIVLIVEIGGLEIVFPVRMCPG